MNIVDIVCDIMSRTSDMTNATFQERVAFVNDETYNTIFSCVTTNTSADGRFVVFKYKSLAVICSDLVMDLAIKKYSEFWELYGGLNRTLRGIVVDTVEKCVVLHPFDKFFNIGQCDEASEISVRERIAKARSVTFTDKLDGSMVSARFYENGYNDFVVATSGTVNPKDSPHLVLAQDMIDKSPNIRRMLRDFPNETFIFEMIHCSDPHVVSYDKSMWGLHLIGMRNMDDGTLWPYEMIVELAREYDIMTTEIIDTNIDEVMSSLDSKRSDEKEGFVVNIDGYLVKIKYNDYCQVHSVFTDVAAVNSVIKAFADDTIDDLLSRCPPAQLPRVNLVIGMIEDYLSRSKSIMYGFYEQNKHLSVADFGRKASAELPKRYVGPVMALYKGKDCNLLLTPHGHYRTLGEMGFRHDDYMHQVRNL